MDRSDKFLKLLFLAELLFLIVLFHGFIRIITDETANKIILILVILFLEVKGVITVFFFLIKKIFLFRCSHRFLMMKLR